MTLKKSEREVVDWLVGHIGEAAPSADLRDQEPALDMDDAYRLQFALMKRLVGQGDKVIGYKAAYTSRAMQKSFDFAGPAIGTLLHSRYVEDGCPVALHAGTKAIVEAEVAVLLKDDLSGPGVTAVDALRAIDGYLPGIEVALMPPAGRSKEMGIAVMKTTGVITVGGPLNHKAIDLRTEGALISLNGVVQSSATAIEVLGDPVNVVVSIANTLGKYGQVLKAGMVLMTGAVVPYVNVSPGDFVDVNFATLGNLHLRLEAAGNKGRQG